MTDDNLLACLVKLSQIIGRPTSSAALLAGLPLIENRLTIELFPRAAAHIDLKAKFKHFPLIKQQFHFPVPVVLLLQDNAACLLTDITENGIAKIIRPPNSTTEEIPVDELKYFYTGQAFVIEVDYRFTSRSKHAAIENKESRWFWDAIFGLWSSYGEMLIASFLINVFALAVPLFTMNVYDRVVPNRSFETLWVLATGIFIVFFFDVLMRNLRGYFIDQAGKLVDLQVSAIILEKVMGIKMSERPGSVGAFSNTIQSFDSVREFITSTTVTILVDLPFAILFLFVIGILGGNLVLVPLIMLPLVVIFGFFLQKPLIEYTQVNQRYAAEKEGILFEILNGIETVKANCAENMMQSRWEQVINLASQVGIKLRFIVNLGIFFSVFTQQLATVVIVIVGVYKISHNELTTGALIACTILAGRALAPMAQIAAILTRYHQTAAALQAINKIMLMPSERPAGHASLQIPVLKGEIEFRDVTFQYEGRNAPLLQNFSLKIHAGERVGIIGRVGSGKTTIAKLILGLLQPTSGSILIDGVDQSQLDLTMLRRGLGYVPQDAMLFYGSLHDNITFGVSDVSDNQIVRAIELAGIDQLVKPSLGSYESMIMEGGKNLSGGQRRVIAIARAVLLDPQILIFDEPTHSMDNQTEAILKARLTFYVQGKTLVLMSHHMSMLSLVERLVILDNGRIIADGPRDLVLKALSEGQIKVPKV